jgi:hypothetical protein
VDPERTGSPIREAPTAASSRTHQRVVAALLFGVLGLVCLPVVGALGAIALGIAVSAELGRSPETRRGDLNLARSAIVLGAVGLILWSAGLACLLVAQTRSPAGPLPRATRGFATAPGPGAASHAPSSLATVSETTSEDRSNLVTSVGSIVLVEVGRDVTSLAMELDSQRAIAAREGQPMLVWLTAPDCPPCNGVAAALADARVQTALGRARLVRVDAAVFAAELGELGLPLDVFPGFALLGTNNRPVDYVDGGEWDQDVPSRIAPVLGQFLHGGLRHRRHPWRGGPRDDETPI